jgi:NAD(P)-dependent dehydrogenase (short-subunit alcohol dehydrogenase family)
MHDDGAQRMFAGKRILITGASSGIGLALAEELASFQPRLGLLARRAALLEEISPRLLARGAAEAVGIPCDVRSREQVRSAVGRLEERWAGIDIAILGAGVNWIMPLRRFDENRFLDVVETNAFGVFHAAAALLPVFRRQGRGLLVGISSMADRRGVPDNLGYCASKAAVTAFLEGLRVGLAREGIRVVTVKPGFVRTPMTENNRFPMPFLVEPQHAARTILSGIAKGKKVVRFPWPTAMLTALFNVLPDGLYDFVLQRTVFAR